MEFCGQQLFSRRHRCAAQVMQGKAHTELLPRPGTLSLARDQEDIKSSPMVYLKFVLQIP